VKTMLLAWLSAPFSFLVGLLMGWLKHGKATMIASSLAGAVVYIVSVAWLTEPLMSLPVGSLDFGTQVFSLTLGVLYGLLGWFIGANYEFVKKRLKSMRS